MVQDEIERRVRFVTRYAVGLTLVLAVVAVAAAGPASSAWFDHLNARTVVADTVRAGVVVAERLNIVEPDGSLALPTANSKRMPGVVLGADTVTTRGGSAGLTFFYEGHEVGGLKHRTDDHLDPPYALDQYHHDQVALVQHDGRGARPRAGFGVNDSSTDFDYKALLDSVAALPDAEREAAMAPFRERADAGEHGGRQVAQESDRLERAMAEYREILAGAGLTSVRRLHAKGVIPYEGVARMADDDGERPDERDEALLGGAGDLHNLTWAVRATCGAVVLLLLPTLGRGCGSDDVAPRTPGVDAGPSHAWSVLPTAAERGWASTTGDHA